MRHGYLRRQAFALHRALQAQLRVRQRATQPTGPGSDSGGGGRGGAHAALAAGLSVRSGAAAVAASACAGEGAADDSLPLRDALRAAAPSHLFLELYSQVGARRGRWARGRALRCNAGGCLLGCTQGFHPLYLSLGGGTRWPAPWILQLVFCATAACTQRCPSSYLRIQANRLRKPPRSTRGCRARAQLFQTLAEFAEAALPHSWRAVRGHPSGDADGWALVEEQGTASAGAEGGGAGEGEGAAA